MWGGRGVHGNPGMVGVVRWMVAIHHRLVLFFRDEGKEYIQEGVL